MNFRIGGHSLELKTSDEAFQPTTTTRLLFESISSVKNARLLDLGCGVGPIAIAAVKCGATSVIAVDYMPQACELATENCLSHGVAGQISVRQSNLYDSVGHDRFDTIVCDVSGMSESVARISPWYPASVPAGGENGTELLERAVDCASQYLVAGGRIIFPVISFTNPTRADALLSRIEGKSLVMRLDRWIPFHPSMMQHMDELCRWQSEGKIEFQFHGSRPCWRLRVFEYTVA